MMSDKKPQHWQRTNHFDGAELWGHELNIYQADTDLLILQIDKLYLIGMANEHGNIVLPHRMPCSSSLESAIFLADELLKPTPQERERKARDEQRRRDDGHN